MKVVVIDGYSDTSSQENISSQVNDYIANHPDENIVDIKYSMSAVEKGYYINRYYSAMIIIDN